MAPASMPGLKAFIHPLT
ncbi:hypothetical protein, partial, partial [Parasitella parasitica]